MRGSRHVTITVSGLGSGDLSRAVSWAEDRLATDGHGADDQSAVDRVAGTGTDERVVDLPPPGERARVVEPHLDVRLAGRLRDGQLLQDRPAHAVGLVQQRGPRGAAVKRQVDVGGGGAERAVVAVEADHRGGLPGQVDHRGTQLGVLRLARAEVVAVDDGEPAVAAGEVAAVAGVGEAPAAVRRVVHDGPAGRCARRVERLVQPVEVTGVPGRDARVGVDHERGIGGHVAGTGVDHEVGRLVPGVVRADVQRVLRAGGHVDVEVPGGRVCPHGTAGYTVHDDLRVQRPAVAGTVLHGTADGHLRYGVQGEVDRGGGAVGDGHPGRDLRGVPVRRRGHVVRADREADVVVPGRVGQAGGVAGAHLRAHDRLARRRVGDGTGDVAVRSGRCEGPHAVGSAEPGRAVVPGTGGAQVRAAAGPVGAARHVVQRARGPVRVLVGVRVRGRRTGQGVRARDDRRAHAGTAEDLPARCRERVVHGRAGLRVGDGGHVRDGAVGAAGVGLYRRLALERRAATAGAAPRRLGPAAGVLRVQQRGTADRRHELGRRRVLHAEAGVARADRDGNARVVEVGVGGDLGRVLRSAVAVGHELRAHVHGRVDRGAQVGAGVGVRLDQQDVAARADRRHHVDVQRDLTGPARVGYGQRGRLAHLVDLGEAAVGGRARRQSELGPVHVEVGLGVRVVEGVDDRDGLARACGRGR